MTKIWIYINGYNFVILTKDYSKNFATWLLKGDMAMFVIKSTVIQINGPSYGSINCMRVFDIITLIMHA